MSSIPKKPTPISQRTTGIVRRTSSSASWGSSTSSAPFGSYAMSARSSGAHLVEGGLDDVVAHPIPHPLYCVSRLHRVSPAARAPPPPNAYNHLTDFGREAIACKQRSAPPAPVPEPRRGSLRRANSDAQGRRASAHRTRALRGRRCDARHAARRVPAQRGGQGEHHASRREPARGSRRGWLPSSPGRTSTASSERPGMRCSARNSRCRPPSRSATCATSAIRSRSSSPRAVTSRKTRSSSSKSTSMRAIRVSTSRPRPRIRSTSYTARGASRPTRWSRCRSRPCPPTSTRPSPTSAARRGMHHPTEPLRLRADGSPGPHRLWTPGRDELELVCSCQGVHETRNFFARYLRMSEAQIRVSARDVGGGFGQKMFVFREECAVVLASRLLGRPVKWIEDRRENLIAAGHSRNEAGTVRLAIDDDHVIQAITIDHVADVGAYPGVPGGDGPPVAAGAVQDPAARASRRRWCGRTRWARPRTAGPGCSRRRHARWRSITPPGRSVSTRSNCVARTCSRLSDLPFTSPSGNLFKEITPLETLEQALEMLDYDDVPRGAGGGARRGTAVGPGHERLRRADVDGRADARDRRRHGTRRGQRPGGRVHGHDVARPERRDHDGAARRRHARRRLRRRHDRAGRHPVDAVRAGHRRQPHRRRCGRRRAPAATLVLRDKVLADRRPHDGGRAGGPRDR